MDFIQGYSERSSAAPAETPKSDASIVVAETIDQMLFNAVKLAHKRKYQPVNKPMSYM